MAYTYGARSIWETRPEAIDDLREFAGRGLSGSLIADEMNKKYGTALTRRAICGKAWRLGIVVGGGADDKGKSARLGLAQRREKAPKKIKRAAIAKPAKPVIDVAEKEEPVVIPTTARVALMDLTLRSCRWPIGDPKDASFGFCGALGADLLADPARPYCAAHATIAYVRAKPPKRVAFPDQHKRVRA